MGRPTKLTEARTKKILKYLADCVPESTSATLSGINSATYFRWKSTGKAQQEAGESGPCRDFYERVTEAVAEAEATLAASFSHAALTDWKAAKSMLALRFPDRWAESRQKGDNVVTVQVYHPDPPTTGKKVAPSTSVSFAPIPTKTYSDDEMES